MCTQPYPSRADLKIPDEWQIMAAQTEDGPMILKVNSGYANLLGHPEYPYQVGVAIPLNSPTSAGMHNEEEGNQVGMIEDLLVESLQTEKLALWVFSQCSSGVKEWVFYTGDPVETAKRINELRGCIKTHLIQNIHQEDPEWEIFQAFTGITFGVRQTQSQTYAHVLSVTIHEYIEPLDRYDRYEHPLNERLAESGLGEVTGGGMELHETFQIEKIDLEVSVNDLEASLPIVISILEEQGAPLGSEVRYEKAGVPHRIEFGRMEGVNLILDAHLPEELWHTYAGDVWPKLTEVLANNSLGEVHGARANQDTTEVFIYGPSAARIEAALTEFRANFPLCRNSKVTRFEK